MPFDERRLELGYEGEYFVADALSKYDIQNHSTLESLDSYVETFNALGRNLERYDHELEYKDIAIEIETKNPSGDYTISQECIQRDWLSKFDKSDNLQIVISSHDVLSSASKKILNKHEINLIVLPFNQENKAILRWEILKLMLKSRMLYTDSNSSRSSPLSNHTIFSSLSYDSPILNFSNYIQALSSESSLYSSSSDSLKSESFISDLFE